ncbi:hypothetical protein ACYTX9_09730, partial [Streptococcus pyogenes]
EDIYVSKETPFNMVYGSAHYPAAYRKFSDEMVSKAIEALITQYDLKFEVAPTAEDFRTGKLWSEKREVFHHGLQSKIHE